MKFENALLFMATMRALIGLAPIVAAGPASKWLGFPPEHDNPSSRLMARLFGVRDIALGAIAVGAVAGEVSHVFALWLNAACDLGDAAMISMPLLRRQGIDKGGITSLTFALVGASAWIVSWWIWVA